MSCSVPVGGRHSASFSATTRGGSSQRPRGDDFSGDRRAADVWAPAGEEGGRHEEASEAHVVPGHFSPTPFHKNRVVTSALATLDTADTGDGPPGKSLREMDEIFGLESTDGVSMQKCFWEKTQKELSTVFSDSLSLHEGGLFVNRTNENLKQYRNDKTSSAPAGINRSHRGYQDERCSIYCQDNNLSFHAFRREDSLRVNQSFPPPLFSSLSTSSSVAVGDRGKGQETTDTCCGSVHGGAKNNWILNDDPQYRGEAGEEPVLLSTILYQGWGKLCEEEAMRWKRSCALAETPLTSDARHETDSHVFKKAVTAGFSQQCAAPSLKPSEPATLLVVTHSPQLENKRSQNFVTCDQIRTLSSCGQEEKEEDKSEAVNMRERRDAFFLEGGRCSVASANGKDARADQVSGEKDYEQLVKTVTRLRLERDNLRHELNLKIICNERLETVLIEKEERYVSQREEWLAREAVLKKKQEQLAVALRQVHRHVSSTTEKTEHKEKELRAARARCCVLETELEAANAETLGLKEACAKRLEECQRLRRQLDQRETGVQLCSDDMGVSSGSEEENEEEGGDFKGNGDGDSTVLDDVLREATVRRLQRVLVAVQRGESRRSRIASQLMRVLKSFEKRFFRKKKLFGANRVLQQLVQLLEGILEFTLEAAREGWESSTGEGKKCVESLPLLHNDDNGHDDLIPNFLNCVQACVFRLGAWMGAIRQRHLELREEVGIVCADQNEFACQQNTRASRLLHQPLFTVELEKARLLAFVEERDKAVWRLKKEDGVIVDSLQEPTTGVSRKPCVDLQAYRERMDAVHSVPYKELERLAEHTRQMVDEFGCSLHALFLKALEGFAKTGERRSVPEKQILRLTGECEVSPRIQDECSHTPRAQLTTMQAESVDKDSAVRTVLRAQSQGEEVLRREQCAEQVSEAQNSLNGSPTSCRNCFLSSPLLVHDECCNIPSVSRVAEPSDVSFYESVAHCRDDETTSFHSTKRNRASPRMQTFASSDAVFEKEQPPQERHFCHHPDPTLSYSAAFASGVALRDRKSVV